MCRRRRGLLPGAGDDGGAFHEPHGALGRARLQVLHLLGHLCLVGGAPASEVRHGPQLLLDWSGSCDEGGYHGSTVGWGGPAKEGEDRGQEAASAREIGGTHAEIINKCFGSHWFGLDVATRLVDRLVVCLFCTWETSPYKEKVASGLAYPKRPKVSEVYKDSCYLFPLKKRKIVVSTC